MPVILNIAEKPSVAKAISVILSGSSNPTSRAGKSKFNRIYEYDYDIGNTYGKCKMMMTSVAGHLYEMEFESPYE